MNSTVPPVYREESDERRFSASASEEIADTVSRGGARAETATESLSGKADDLSQKASAQFEKIAEKAGETARNMAEQGREAGQRVQEVAGHMKGAVSRSVKEQPMVTLALAAAVGFVMGALWKS